MTVSQRFTYAVYALAATTLSIVAAVLPLSGLATIT